MRTGHETASRLGTLAGIAILAGICGSTATGADLTLETVTAPPANRADEPLASQFSLAAATEFLDSASLHWINERKCFTCHTNYSYLMARPMVSHEGHAHRQVRAALEELVEVRWKNDKPRWDAEVVMSGAILAFNDAATTHKLHPTTRKALDRMWEIQKEDGGIAWLKCDWPPMESDDHYGATMVLIGVGVAPEKYAETPAAKAGVEKLLGYLRANPPPMLHHRAMLLWASRYFPAVLSAEEKQAVIAELRGLQKKDGGWSSPTLGTWQRADDKPQDPETPDGYATGFVTYVLRQAGVPAEDPQLMKSVAWLQKNQRESGRWYSRSLHKDNLHFLSHAGSAFAVMALVECGVKQ